MLRVKRCYYYGNYVASIFRFVFNLYSRTPDLQPWYKCTNAGPLHGTYSGLPFIDMEHILHYRSSTTTISTAKVMEWFPRLSSFMFNNTRGPATPEPLSPPGSLRDTHEAACAWFLGPRAENADYLKMYVEIILDDLVQCRRNFSQDDEVSISSSSC